jgi:hypothetical protein
VCASQSNIKSELIIQFTGGSVVSTNPLLMRPHIVIATLCERHILEADGALTLFRIIDRFNVSGITEEFPPTLLEFTLVVRFVSGSCRGNMKISLSPIDPNHTVMQTMTVPALFEGDDERNVTFLGKIKIEVKEAGLYWIAIAVEGEEYTRTPLRVAYQRQPTIQMGG